MNNWFLIGTNLLGTKCATNSLNRLLRLIVRIHGVNEISNSGTCTLGNTLTKHLAKIVCVSKGQIK